MNINHDKRSIIYLTDLSTSMKFKLFTCSEEDYKNIYKKYSKREELLTLDSLKEEDINSILNMPEAEYNLFHQISQKCNINFVRFRLRLLLNKPASFLQKVLDRVELIENSDVTNNQIEELLAMPEKDYRKKITKLSEREVEADIDPEEYRRELQELMDGTYVLDMSAYNKSRAKKASEKQDNRVVVEFKEEDAFIPQSKEPSNLPNSSELIESLENTGKTEVSIPITSPNFKPKGDNTKGRIEPGQRLGEFPTGITLHFGEGRSWDNSRFARDMIQNFYDGNGNTLEGVDINIVKKGDRYIVKISGKGIYDHKQVTKLGLNAHTPKDAGKYGEGLKVMFTTLLDSRGATYVRHSSGDWVVNLTKGEGESSSNTLVKGELERAETRQEGATVEFDTTDAELVQEILKAKDYFYSPSNPDFAKLDYENEYFGIKLLPKGEKGNIYVVQRYEVEGENNLDNTIDGMTIVFKVMPDAPEIQNDVYNKQNPFKLQTGRNRTPLTKSEIVQLVSRYAMTIPKEDLIRIIGSMKDTYLINSDNGSKSNNIYILLGLVYAAQERRIKVDFGHDNFVAMGVADKESIQFAKMMGKILVRSEMGYVGVPTLYTFFLENKKGVLPKSDLTPVQANKLKLIDKTIKLFVENLDIDNLHVITQQEAENPRYIYKKPKRNNDNEAAEAIVDMYSEKSFGMWVDEEYFNNSYRDIFGYMATWLHEISHKVGGDGTNVFNRRLSLIIKLATEMCERDPAFRTKLRVLNEEFRKLNNQTNQFTLQDINSEEYVKQLEQSLSWIINDPEPPAPNPERVAQRKAELGILPDDYEPTTLDWVANKADSYKRKTQRWFYKTFGNYPGSTLNRGKEQVILEEGTVN